MKLAVIADVHGNFEALCAVLDDISKRRPEIIVNLGDHVSGPLQPRETADLLSRSGYPTIRGNHDRQVLYIDRERMGPSDRFAADLLDETHRKWLVSLPPTAWLTDEVFLCHGTPSSDCEYFLEQVTESGSHPAESSEVLTRTGDVRASLILCGHTHIPRSERLADGRLIVNPGSVGLQAYEDQLPFPHKMEIGTPHARYAFLELRNSWEIEFIQVRYDWERAAELAASRGCEDWARALRTGKV
jgi:predicted phosphodiesterase